MKQFVYFDNDHQLKNLWTEYLVNIKSIIEYASKLVINELCSNVAWRKEALQ